MNFLFLPFTNNENLNEPKNETEIKPIDEPIKIECETETKNLNKKQKNKEYSINFITTHKEKIKEKILCPICYSSYTYFNKSKHNKTKRHLTLLNVKNTKNVVINLN